jgi:hypothetical protein
MIAVDTNILVYSHREDSATESIPGNGCESSRCQDCRYLFEPRGG